MGWESQENCWEAFKYFGEQGQMSRRHKESARLPQRWVKCMCVDTFFLILILFTYENKIVIRQ